MWDRRQESRQCGRTRLRGAPERVRARGGRRDGPGQRADTPGRCRAARHDPRPIVRRGRERGPGRGRPGPGTGGPGAAARGGRRQPAHKSAGDRRLGRQGQGLAARPLERASGAGTGSRTLRGARE